MNNIELILAKVVEEINMQLDNTQQLINSNEELLSKEGSKLDSLGLLSFISILEEYTSEYDVDFMDIVMTGDENKIFETIGTLKEFLLKLK